MQLLCNFCVKTHQHTRHYLFHKLTALLLESQNSRQQLISRCDTTATMKRLQSSSVKSCHFHEEAASVKKQYVFGQKLKYASPYKTLNSGVKEKIKILNTDLSVY